MRRNQSSTGRKLTFLSLTAATYFMVSGGPYGIEEVVQNSGYKLALVIIVLTPLFWSFPTALMVGELSAAIPAEGGFYVWVRRAMGSFWGYQEAWLSLASSMFDMAAYPTVFVLALGKLWPEAIQGHKGVLIACALILACVLWNLFGAGAVGDGSVWLGAAMLVPFLVIIAAGLFRRASLSSVSPTASVHVDWLTGVIVAMWNYTGWDNASTVAEEVEDPQRTYPRVMMISLIVITLSYAVPIIAVWRTHLQPAHWSAGSWAHIASLLGGPWLGIALLVGWMISTFGIVNSLTMSYSRLPMTMAEDGYLPRIFTRKLRSGAPWVAIVACGAAWITVVCAFGINLDRLLLLDILLYGASLVLEFIALVVLRVREPQLHRPFTIRGGVAVTVVIGIFPTAMLAVAYMKNRDERLGSISALTLALIFMAAGVVFYFIAALIRRRRGKNNK